jgi:hypothetical protein
MFKTNSYATILASLAVAGFLGTNTARADSLAQVTGPSAQQATDSINWAKVGGDQTLLSAGGSVPTTKGATVQVALTGPNAMLSRVCSASPCSWAGAGLTPGDILLWTSDAGNGGTGPVRITFASGMAGAGAFIQADGPGQFTGKIEAFNGSTSLGSFTSNSNSLGQPVYLGVLDQTAPHITSVVFSLTAVSEGVTTDFGMDAVGLSSAIAAPAVSLTPSSLAFGNQPVGSTSSSKQITLKNVGNATLTIQSIAATGDFKQSNNCGSVAAGASCVITVTFHPLVSGARTGAITVTDNAKPSPQTASLSGTGIAPVVHFSRTAISFPAQLLKTQSGIQTVTLSNTGTAPLTFTSIAATGDFKESNNCVSPIAIGASCTISVSFAPTATGNRTGAIAVTDNAAGSPQKVSLSGIGTEVKLSAAKLTFPVTTVGKASASQTVTLTNAGTTALSITSISLTGTDPADFKDTKTCGTSVPAGGSCSIAVVFQPRATGARSANLAVADNGGASPQQVTLTGTGQ